MRSVSASGNNSFKLIKNGLHPNFHLIDLIEDKKRAALIGAIIALLGSIDAPLIYFASILWRTAHPELNIGPLADEENSGLPSSMVLTFFISLLAHTFLFIILVRMRLRVKKLERLNYE